MKASDIMTTGVIAVAPDASVQETAQALLRNRVSGVPVIDSGGKLVGIVSENDLMRRVESGTERRHSGWLEIFTSKQTLADDFVKSHSRKVSDVMSREVVTVGPDMPVAQVAELLERKGIKRVPVVEGGKVVGIVSRANLLQALATLKPGQASQVAPNDAEIRRNILAQLREQAWATPIVINVLVQDGTADLWGVVDSAEEKRAIRVLAETSPGVRAIRDNLLIQPIMAGI